MPRGLTKELIVQAALDLLDSEGVDGLTVRALATRLQVKAPALYWHVSGKRELVDEMATEVWRRVVADLDALPETTAWDDELRAFGSIVRAAFLSHRDGARVFSGTYLTDAAVLARQEVGMRRWIDQGFALRDVIRAFSLVYNFTVGFCIEEQTVRDTGDDGRYDPDRRAARVGAAEHPLVAASGAEVFGDAEARFTDQYEVLVEAVGRMRADAPQNG